MGRGLRQGDLLSPFLYLVVAEGLSRLMSLACSRGSYNPVKVGKDEVLVSHLQYADDSILFGEAKKENLEILKSVLWSFEWFSGLKINYRKSCLMGIGVEDNILANWANYLNCSLGDIPFVYLGLPIGDKPSDKHVWNKVVERLENKLVKWENNFLFGGLLVLTNAVLTSLPLYFLSFYKIPTFILNRLKRLQCHFFMGGSLGEKRKIACVSWDVVCKSKEKGGLGVKNLEWFNIALLGKWVWRLLVGNNALWSKLLIFKYGDLVKFCGTM